MRDLELQYLPPGPISYAIYIYLWHLSILSMVLITKDDGKVKVWKSKYLRLFASGRCEKGQVYGKTSNFLL